MSPVVLPLAVRDYGCCWVSELGMDGSVILERIGADGMTHSERQAEAAAAAEAADAAEAERRREEAAQRRKDFDDGLARQRREVDELAASFEGMKETLSSLQTQRREASSKVMEQLDGLKKARSGVRSAQVELEAAFTKLLKFLNGFEEANTLKLARCTALMLSWGACGLARRWPGARRAAGAEGLRGGRDRARPQ